MSAAICQQSVKVIEAARKAGIQPSDELAVLLAEITGLAEAVGKATAEGPGVLREAAEHLRAATKVQQEDAQNALFRAGLVVARQLAVKVERRTTMAIGVAGVLVAVLAGYTGYEIGSAQPGPVAVCWQQGGKQVCGPAVWIGSNR